jgi:glutamate carboxypeptidase
MTPDTHALAQGVRDEAARVHLAACADLDLLLADLKQWVTSDSPSGDVDAVNSLAGVLAERCESYGFRSELVPSAAGSYLHAVIEGPGRAKVALLCHHDTVFARGSAAERPYRRDGNLVFGPGVADMKGGIAVALHAARLLASGRRPFGRLELVSAPDEETRTGAPTTIDRVVGFDAVLCFECGRADHSIVSARKGGRWVRVAARGRSAHAGVDPDGGRNAVLALCQEAVRLADLHGAREGLTLQITGFQGGEAVNSVPAAASMTCDLRALTKVGLEWAIGEIGRFGPHDGVSIRAQDLGGPPPLERSAAVAELARTAILIGAELGHRFGESATGGVSDGSWTAGAGIPTLDGLGPAGGLDHTPAEYAEVDTLAPRVGVVAGLVAAIDAGLLDRVQFGSRRERRAPQGERV